MLVNAPGFSRAEINSVTATGRDAVRVDAHLQLATNLGIQNAFHLGERVQMNFGAEFNNIFNHPLFSPDNSDFANLASFAIGIHPKTNRILPITNITPDPDFDRLLTSYTQEGIDSRRTTRLKLRFTF